MKNIVNILIVSAVLAVSSICLAADNFQLTTSSDGNVYRMNVSTGEVWIIKGDSMEKVKSKEFSMKIGQRYIGEDLYSFSYLGKGQVGDIKTLGDFYIDKKK